MNNQRKFIVIINEFPKVLNTITTMLRDDKVDFILDASRYAKPVSLLRVARPDNVLLKLNMSSKQAIQLTGKNLSENMEIKKGMITGNAKAYYMSLCSTFWTNYEIDEDLDFELIPAALAKQQLN
ncbi:MAG TPA: hypothetical protein VIJ92_12990 [Ginsengibacter sp.]